MKERPPQPSNFCLKLRKHVRTRRLEDVRQLGVDRIVDLTFGTGNATVHIILELYSSVRLPPRFPARCSALSPCPSPSLILNPSLRQLIRNCWTG